VESEQQLDFLQLKIVLAFTGLTKTVLEIEAKLEDTAALLSNPNPDLSP
jgi:hypothetical protein